MATLMQMTNIEDPDVDKKQKIMEKFIECANEIDNEIDFYYDVLRDESEHHSVENVSEEGPDESDTKVEEENT